jgi:hypothetical protein
MLFSFAYIINHLYLSDHCSATHLLARPLTGNLIELLFLHRDYWVFLKVDGTA